jgi:hypothetical protein
LGSIGILGILGIENRTFFSSLFQHATTKRIN